jgi:hypothetical protein
MARITGDQRRRNGRAASVLTEALLSALAERLRTPPEDGGTWTGPKDRPPETACISRTRRKNREIPRWVSRIFMVVTRFCSSPEQRRYRRAGGSWRFRMPTELARAAARQAGGSDGLPPVRYSDAAGPPAEQAILYRGGVM